jgi:sugar O-acyltransferase (sialic acid O-acetyltransferase NeuD family)
LKRLLIYGASYAGTLKIVRAINERNPTYEVVGFIDDVKYGKEREYMGLPILGGGEYLDTWRADDGEVLNNVYATTSGRKAVTERIMASGRPAATLVHPDVDTAFSNIGNGCLVMGGVDMGVNTTLADHAAVKMNSVISHDCQIGRYVFVGPGAVICGHVRVEEGAFIGAGALIKERLTIGAWSVVGIGACVIRDVEPDTTVAGNPACPLR